MNKAALRDFLKNISLFFVSLILFLVIFEIGLRLFWKMSTLKGQLYVSSKDVNLRYELKPNAKVGFVTINSEGFRDNEYSRSKDEGTMRVIILGDSETFGKSMKLEDTFPKKLQYSLNGKCPRKKIEVLNMGVEGYNTIQEYEFLKVKGLDYNPDLVLLYYCLNDTDKPEYYFKKNFLNTHFLLPRYIQYRVKKFLVKRDKKMKGVKNEAETFRYLYDSSDSWHYTTKAILDIKHLSEKYNFKFAVVVVAEMSSLVLDFRDNYPYGYINDMLADFCHNNGIMVIDPTVYLREKNYNPMDLVLGPEDRHKNPFANSIIAGYVAGELLKKRVIECR